MVRKMIQDHDGLPSTLFHGSYREIRAFNPLRTHEIAGIYFTPHFEDAVEHAVGGCIEDGDNPTVMVVNLDIRNPYTIHGIESHVISVSRRDELIAMGHDGVVGINNGQIEEYVAFHPDQVTIIDVLHDPDPKEGYAAPATLNF